MALTVFLSSNERTSNTPGARLSITAMPWENSCDTNSDAAGVRRGQEYLVGVIMERSRRLAENRRFRRSLNSLQ